MTEKLKLHTPNITDENVTKLAALFPHCVSEGKIDFELLKQELSNSIIDGTQERYQLNWVGKREALLTANAPIAKTLRPCREESVNFDTTENLYIEGDNLDALKLLQETYLNKVKMIYIDPPYNTGNDFIYEDDFAENTADYLQRSNQKDESGNRLTANPESNGRFHSDWLSMMYPRLKLARNLLRDDGVIFISIDDNEAHNLRKLMDEVFGEASFISDVCVINNLKGRNDKKYIATANERLFVYVKSELFNEYGLDLPSDTESEYKYIDTLGNHRLIELRKRGGSDTRKERPNMYYPFYVNPLSGSVSLEKSEEFNIETYPMKSNGDDGRWRWGKETASTNLNYLIGKTVAGRTTYNVYEKDYLETNGEIRRIKPKSVMAGADYSTDSATKQYRAIMDKIDFSNPKPVPFIEDFVTYSSRPDQNDIILDFFSGSATTAHAVFSRNSKDGGKRKFIMVQIPEACDEKSEAFKAGYKTIADIGKERIRRAGQKIKTDNALTATDLDIGFRVLKVDSSNMNEVYYSPDAINKDDLHLFINNIKDDRSDEDLLFQVLLDWGVDLTLPIERQTIDGKTVFVVAVDAIVACFDRAEGVSESFIKELAKIKPLRAVFCDGGFANDSVKINVEQIFKTISPTTEIKTI